MRTLCCCLYFAFFLSLPHHIWAQARISARLDTTRIYVGTPLRLYVTLQIPKNSTVQAPQELPDSSGLARIDTLKTNTTDRNDTRIFTQTWTLTALDSGRFVVPALQYTYKNGANAPTALATPALVFEALLMPVDTTKIQHIAPIMTEPFWWSDLQYWFAALLLVAIGAFIYVKIKNRRKTTDFQRETAAEPVLSPHEWAYTALARLEKNNFLGRNNNNDNERHKKHYAELSTIFRTYIERRYNTPILEKTSDEILPILAKNVTHWQVFEADIRHFLQTADLIKFAKATTTPPEDATFWQIVTNFIDYDVKMQDAEDVQAAENA